MAFDFSTLITDRSPEDLQALRDLLATPMADWTAEQLAQFNQAASKGTYNYTDFNRVIAAMDDINERLTAAGYVTAYHPIIVHPATPPEPVGPLPDGYTQLEYIQSSGTQYVDTGIKPNQDTIFRLKFAMTDISADYAMFGCRDTTSSGMFMALNRSNTFRISIAASIGRFVEYSADATQVTDLSLRHGTVTIGGTTEDISSDPFQCSYNCLLFAAINGGTPACRAHMKLYGCEIYDGSTLIRNFIPCKNDSNEIGLFDISQGVFHGNNGKGSFVAGPEVQPAPDPEPEPGFDPYTWYESDVPTVSLMDEYLANVSALRAVLDLPETTPEVPADMDRLTQSEANDIEDILGIIHTYLLALQSILRRCGAVVCGGPELYFVN